jgi:hypothetical protein
MNFAGSAQCSFILPFAIPTDLASVHALVGDERLRVVLEPVWLTFVSERFILIRGRLRTLRKVTRARGAPVIFVSPGPKMPHNSSSTHHDRNRGQSPSRHLGCSHCAQPVPVSFQFLRVASLCDRAGGDVQSRECGIGRGPCSSGCWP